jgi:hypothetical protein
VVDAGNLIRMCCLEDYKTSCGRSTWDSMMEFAAQLKEKRN